MELLKLYDIADKEDIEVVDFRLRSASALSEMDTDLSCYIALDKRKLTTTAEEKTALAHELGHCMTGSFYNRYSPFDSRDRHERRANKKAAYIVIPLDELIDACRSPWNRVCDLAEHFEVTEDFMLYAMGLYQDELFRAFADVREM